MSIPDDERSGEELRAELKRLRARVAELEAAREEDASTEELRNIFNLSLDLICIADIEKQTFLKTNPAFSKVLGYSEEELRDRPFDDFIHPEDIEKTDAVIEDQLRQGKEVFDFENRYRCKDGSYRWLSWVSKPNPREGKTFAVARDVTEWKSASQLLENHKRLLDATNRIARVGGWELDAKTREVTWTEGTHHIHEVPLDEQPPLEEAIAFFHPDDRPRLEEALREALEKGTPYDMELRFTTAKGRHLWTRTMCEPEWRDGEIVKLKGVFHDVTERRLAEEERERLWHQLQQAQKMDALGTLAGGIAHDFNNLLVGIMGFSELVQDELEPDHPALADVEEITNAASRARELVRQILTYSRKAQPEKRPLVIDDVVAKTLSLLERTVPKNIQFELERCREPKQILANAQQMEQVLLNLGSNAADAMPEGGVITVRSDVVEAQEIECDVCGSVFSGEFALLEVEDRGVGIEQERRDLIFDPFFTTKDIGAGTGLGLSTVLGIVSSLDGHIVCDTEVGVGTTFGIYIPVTDSTTPKESPENGVDGEPPEAHGALLVVDDDDAARTVASRILQQSGYSVLTARSGEEALEIHDARRDDIDGVILDLGMPGMGGKACLAALRERDPDAKVMVVSGYLDLGGSEELKALGARHTVAKPYRMKLLLEQLRSMLDH